MRYGSVLATLAGIVTLVALILRSIRRLAQRLAAIPWISAPRLAADPTALLCGSVYAPRLGHAQVTVARPITSSHDRAARRASNADSLDVVIFYEGGWYDPFLLWKQWPDGRRVSVTAAPLACAT